MDDETTCCFPTLEMIIIGGTPTQLIAGPMVDLRRRLGERASIGQVCRAVSLMLQLVVMILILW